MKAYAISLWLDYNRKPVGTAQLGEFSDVEVAGWIASARRAERAARRAKFSAQVMARIGGISRILLEGQVRESR